MIYSDVTHRKSARFAFEMPFSSLSSAHSVSVTALLFNVHPRYLSVLRVRKLTLALLTV